MTGNLVTDVRLGNTKGDGTPVASFRLAHTSRRFNREHQAWVDDESDYYTVTCWRQMAENIASSLHKGDPVVVFGRQRVRDWQREDRRGTTAEIEAQAVGHDLSRGISSFVRKRRGQAAPSEVGDLADQLAAELDAESSGEAVERGHDEGVRERQSAVA